MKVFGILIGYFFGLLSLNAHAEDMILIEPGRIKVDNLNSNFQVLNDEILRTRTKLSTEIKELKAHDHMQVQKVKLSLAA